MNVAGRDAEPRGDKLHAQLEIADLVSDRFKHGGRACAANTRQIPRVLRSRHGGCDQFDQMSAKEMGGLPTLKRLRACPLQIAEQQLKVGPVMQLVFPTAVWIAPQAHHARARDHQEPEPGRLRDGEAARNRAVEQHCLAGREPNSAGFVYDIDGAAGTQQHRDVVAVAADMLDPWDNVDRGRCEPHNPDGTRAAHGERTTKWRSVIPDHLMDNDAANDFGRKSQISGA